MSHTSDTLSPAIFDLLRTEHREVASLMEAIAATEENGAEDRPALFGRLYKALLPHARAEEETLYARIREEDATRDIALEGVQEHRVVSLLLGELNEMATHGETWMAKFKVLKENVDHHVKEEEGEMFPKARKVLSAREQEEITTAYREARQRHLATLRG